MAAPGRKRPLRSGYTTGACAAAAAKAATLCLLGRICPETVEIPFPDGSRHGFALCRTGAQPAMATVVKDAGDDPDVTNGAEIGAEVRWLAAGRGERIVLANGPGVGLVTKPGLPIPMGEAAINPIPRQMIRAAVAEALEGSGREDDALEVRIFVRDGEILAEKTLNRRLGVIGGLSILGTTGIVRPVSAKAWTDTIEASMQVARAVGLTEAILSTGRTSEAMVQGLLRLPEEAQVMMGDYLRYALEAARRHGFCRVHLAAMWAKLIKASLAVPQTHVRNGALEVRQAADLLARLGLDRESAADLQTANTAREIYERLKAMRRDDLIGAVCRRAQEQARQWSGLPVRVYLVTAEEGVVHVED
ncbi:MAG: cobalt-precorrin-5B (C(1))-methyltransferase [Desulfobulbus sp.]|jgi:cobalt-precorrin-5B (C1)-methyltransferase|uniref:cobalt-precorrin-5B (C(1))-methyltransferase n=1 Tax=Desulfobulbus sp. TaxID=895 RepID=UPI00283BD741|nr:cobalt-precorrin-5B (C(1))-methyltransferase [Desulfobulbus sp.]MDR2549716.1 cobalt-precorrin-5B (C(1))-methyltransferase [Desulfobulbus sp.]